MKRAEGPQGCAAKPAKKREGVEPHPISLCTHDDGRNNLLASHGDDGVGGRCRGCAGVTSTGGGPATCVSPQTGAGQRLGLRRRRVCLSLMAGMRRAPGIAEEGERARPSGARPPRAIGAPGVVKVVGGGWAGRQPAPWEAGPSFVRRR